MIAKMAYLRNNLPEIRFLVNKDFKKAVYRKWRFKKMAHGRNSDLKDEFSESIALHDRKFVVRVLEVKTCYRILFDLGPT